MAKNRYFNTEFWDDPWIQKVGPNEKYFYIYLLTNPLTNIAGIYEISVARISFDTGLEANDCVDLLARLEENKKVFYFKSEWIIIINWPKHQKIGGANDNIKKGIDRILLGLPEDVWQKIIEADYQYKHLAEVGRPLQAPSSPLKPLERGQNVKTSPLKPLELSNPNLNPNLNINLNLNDSEEEWPEEPTDPAPASADGGGPGTDDQFRETLGKMKKRSKGER